MRPLKSISKGSLLCFLLTAPVLMSGTKSSEIATPSITKAVVAPTTAKVKSTKEIILDEAASLYETMQLDHAGLNKKAFELAWQGYKHLVQSGKIKKTDVLSICDFSQSSRKKRLYIIDVEEQKILIQTFVAHGRNSGGEYAKKFSNKPDSHMSSLGFYKTRSTYFGGHGLALTVDGLEKGINDKANKRKIVIHGSNYVGSNFIKMNKFNGRSFGCPAVPAKDTKKVINTIKNGSCLFIYHPTQNYLTKSTILND